MKRLGRIAAVVFAVIAAFAIAGYFSAGTACAHDPRFACSPRGTQNPIDVRDAQKSWAFYGHLAGGQSDVYTLRAARPLRVSWSLLVDRRDAANPARPAVVVRDARGQERAHLDFSHATRFYEPFSRESYLSTANASLALAAGSYTATVTMEHGLVPQRYTFAVGDAERFSIVEIPYVFGAIGRIRSLRY